MLLDSESKKIISESRILIKRLLGLGIIFIFLYVLVILFFIYIPLDKTMLWLTPFMIAILIIEIISVYLSILLAQTGEKNFSRPMATTGMLVIILGIWLDVISTIVVNPDLAREGNPFILFAQELHAPLWSVYLLGFFAQLGITIISCSLWLSFIRHHRVYLQLVRAMSPRGLLQFIWVALGGNLKTTINHPKQNLFSRLYRVFWIFILYLIEPFSRIIFGLAWLGFSLIKLLVPYFGMGTIYFIYVITMSLVTAAFIG